MDMNAFRNHLAQKSGNEGLENAPKQVSFGDVLSSVKEMRNITPDTIETKIASIGETITGRDIVEAFVVVDTFNEMVSEDFEDATNLGEIIQECVGYLSVDDDDERDIIESYDLVDSFYGLVMEERGLNENSEDLHEIVEGVLDVIDLDETYHSMPTQETGPNDDEKRKMQKGESSKMPKAGVEDKLPDGLFARGTGMQSFKVKTGGKKSSAANAAY